MERPAPAGSISRLEWDVRFVSVLAIALLAVSACPQRTQSGVVIPPEFQREFQDAVRRHDRKKIQEILARIPRENPLTGRLYDAISEGNVGRVRDLLNKGADPNANRANGWRPLISLGGSDEQACRIAALLISKGANVDYRQPDQGWTPLLCAVSRSPGGLPLVKLLLDKGARIDGSMNDGLTALHMAVRWEDQGDIVRELLKRGANKEARTHPIDPSPIEGEVDPELQKMRGETDRHNRETYDRLFEPGYRDEGRTPLFEAARAGKVEMAKLLLAAGANAQAGDANDWSLLHEAAHNGQAAMLRVLVAKGLDPNARSRAGNAPLHLAARAMAYGPSAPSIESIKALLDAGADKRARNRDGKTAYDLVVDDSARNVAEWKPKLKTAGDRQFLARYEALIEEAKALLKPPSLR